MLRDCPELCIYILIYIYTEKHMMIVIEELSSIHILLHNVFEEPLRVPCWRTPSFPMASRASWRSTRAPWRAYFDPYAGATTASRLSAASLHHLINPCSMFRLLLITAALRWSHSQSISTQSFFFPFFSLLSQTTRCDV